MRTIKTEVNGERRRICDIVAASPWAVNTGHYATSAASAETLKLAEGILRDRTTVLFSDEAASEIRGFKEKADAIWVETPGVMPPFKSLFIESATHGKTVGRDFVALGVHLKTWDIRDVGSFDNIDELRVRSPKNTAESRPFMETLREDLRPRVRAFIRGCVWIQRDDGSVWGPVADFIMPITDEFRVMRCEKVDDWYDPLGADERAIGKPIVAMNFLSTIPGYEGDYARLVADAIFLSGAISIRTIGMMNASNVKYVEGGRTNAAVGEKRRRADNLAWIKYHVLKLKVGTQLRELPRFDKLTDGVKPDPLRIVRGHFKDFSEKGLFGKHRGDKYGHIWCPSFVRGVVDDGVVVKDYEPVGVAASTEVG